MEKYIQYTVSDFIADDSFIRWVNGMSEKDDLDWDSWLQEHPSKKEEIEQAVQGIKSLKFAPEQIPSKSKNEIWSKIDQEIHTESIKPKNKPAIYRRLIVAAAAAVAALVLFFNVFTKDFDTSYNTSFAEIKTIDLPDGSNIILNALSEVKFNQEDWENERTILLDGEAFFEVEKGSRFLVKTHSGEVEVLGTSFNVYSRNTSFKVLCETGKVSVKSNNDTEILMPAQSVDFIKGKKIFTKSVQKNEKRSTWTKGIYNYKGVDLITVCEDIERQLDVDIILPEQVKAIKFSGSFDSNNRDEILSEVLWPLGLTFTKNGRKVMVSEE